MHAVYYRMLQQKGNPEAESKKQGGCGLFAFQSPAQIETIYDHTIAKTIIGNYMTKIIFAEQVPQILDMDS